MFRPVSCQNNLFKQKKGSRLWQHFLLLCSQVWQHLKKNFFVCYFCVNVCVNVEVLLTWLHLWEWAPGRCGGNRQSQSWGLSETDRKWLRWELRGPPTQSSHSTSETPGKSPGVTAEHLFSGCKSAVWWRATGHLAKQWWLVSLKWGKTMIHFEDSGSSRSATGQEKSQLS